MSPVQHELLTCAAMIVAGGVVIAGLLWVYWKIFVILVHLAMAVA